jgi:hypothetical protein
MKFLGDGAAKSKAASLSDAVLEAFEYARRFEPG